MYPKAGEADELKMASHYSGDMLMPKAFVLFFPTNNLTQSNNMKSETALVSVLEYPFEPLLGKSSTTKCLAASTPSIKMSYCFSSQKNSGDLTGWNN